jgi:LPXTG-motif cell wall-anchored protein
MKEYLEKSPNLQEDTLKKVMLLAAMLAMVLVAAAPAFAQTAVDDSLAIDNSSTVEYNAVCQNVIGSIETGDAAQYGDADAFADDESAAVAEIAAELDTSVDVVNECLNASGVVEYSSTSAAAASASASASSAAAASSGGTLPDTGGASFIALGAGALLVAGGLVARKIVR